MSDLPRQIRLAAGDYFMHAQDRRIRQVGMPGNVCYAIHRLGRGVDMDRLRHKVETSPILDWLARVQVVRPLAVLPPLWKTVSWPRAVLFEHHIPGEGGDDSTLVPQAIRERELHPARGPGLAIDVVYRADDVCDLILSWNHTLLDARGVDLLLSHLNASNDTNGASAGMLLNPNQRGWDPSGWLNSLKKARGSVSWLNESGREPLFSLLPDRPPKGPRRNQYRLISFNPDDTARINARGEKLNCGFRRSHFYLAALLRALHTIAVKRGNKTGAYLAPVPHDTRRRGSNGPIFSNHLSILFYRIEPQQAGRLSDIVAELSRQMTKQIRDRFPECCMAALDMFKPILPLGVYGRHLGKPTRGKFATVCFSDSGEACAGMKDLLGAPLLDVKHLVPTWRPPGLTVVFFSFGGGLSAVLSWTDDCLSPAEAETLERGIRAALLEEEIA